MSRTLNEAIRHAMNIAEKQEELAKVCVAKRAKDDCLKCAEEHRQLAEWLKELAERRKQPIIFCKDCEKHNKRFDEYPADEACPLTVWRVAQEHEFDYQFCAYAERRTGEQ